MVHHWYPSAQPKCASSQQFCCLQSISCHLLHSGLQVRGASICYLVLLLCCLLLQTVLTGLTHLYTCMERDSVALMVQCTSEDQNNEAAHGWILHDYIQSSSKQVCSAGANIWGSNHMRDKSDLKSELQQKSRHVHLCGSKREVSEEPLQPKETC